MDFKTLKSVTITNIFDSYFDHEYKDFHENLETPISFEDFCEELESHNLHDLIIMISDDQNDYDDRVKELWEETK